jgi:hypothetical protein
MAKMRKENTRSITQLFGLVTYFTEFQTFQAELTSPVFSKLFWKSQGFTADRRRAGLWVLASALVGALLIIKT